MSEPQLEPVEVTVKEEREKSYLFSAEGKPDTFFPKSEVSFKRRNVNTQEAIALIPLWLLEKKGW